MNGIYVVALAACACLGYIVAVYQRRLQERNKPAPDPQTSSGPTLEPELVKQFLKRLAETAQANPGTQSTDWGWVDGVLGELDSGGADGRTILAAAERLMEMSRQLEDQLAEARSQRPGRPAEYFQQFIDLELRRRLAELRRHGTPFSVLRLRAEFAVTCSEQTESEQARPTNTRLGESIGAALREIDFCVPDGPGRFTAVLPATRLIQAEQVAHRLRQVVRSQEGTPAGVRLWVGVAQALATENARSLLSRADQALEATSPKHPVMVHHGEKCLPAQGRLRSSRRYQTGGKIRVAAYQPDKPVEDHVFSEVECQDLSQGGVAFLSETIPASGELLVAFPNREEGTLLVAAIRSRSEVRVEGKRLWRIGCQFTRRLERSAETA